MNIFYPTPPIVLTTSSSHYPPPPPLPPNYYYYLPPPDQPLKKVHHTILRTDLWNKSVPSDFDGSLSPLLYFEVQPSSHVDGALVVTLEGLVCSPPP